GFFDRLGDTCAQLTDGLVERARQAGIPLACNRVGGMFGLFFTGAAEVNNFYDVGQCNLDRFRLFFHEMLNHGVYLAPSAYEAGFVSAAHDAAALEATFAAAEKSFAAL
ncbi:MAG: aspartate aminotransferase family protein, partial [Gammaproteobacteria bacterium]